jgi:hypothetical protein
MDACPHALEGKTLKVASMGTNPYIYTDFQRNVVYNDKGHPVGSNTEIAATLGKVFGFDFKIILSGAQNYYDNKTGTWIGLTGEVSLNLHSINTLNTQISPFLIRTQFSNSTVSNEFC